MSFYRCFGKYLQMLLRGFFRCFFIASTVASLRTYIFNDMIFSEPFRAVALGLLSYLVVRIMNKFIFLFLISYFHQPFFMVLRSSFINMFRKLQDRKSACWSLYFIVLQGIEVETLFFRISLKFPYHQISRVT